MKRSISTLTRRILRRDLLSRVARRILERYPTSDDLPAQNGKAPAEARWQILLRQHQARMSALAAQTGRRRLDGKVAVITGAGSGIGRSIAVLFAREGARVVVADVNQASGEETVGQIQAIGGSGIFVRSDVTSDDSVQGLVVQVKDSYGRIDVLVNNAGANVVGGVLNLSLDRWEKGLELNLTAVYRCCRFVVPEISKTGGGSVIVMASVQGIAGFWESSAYAAAKGGLISLTRQLACDLGNQRIRVNSISPSVVKTPIFDSLEGKDAMFKTVSEYAPLGHIGVPEDVALAAVFLASDESSYITGTNLVIDGGMTMRGI